VGVGGCACVKEKEIDSGSETEREIEGIMYREKKKI